MKKKLLLDSYALLAYLKKEDNYEAVKESLSSPDAAVIMNELNVGETYYILSRQRGQEQADYFLQVVLPGLSIGVVSNDFEMVIAASKLKARYSMSYMDCFAVATAIRQKAIVVTGDPEFGAAEGIVDILWLR